MAYHLVLLQEPVELGLLRSRAPQPACEGLAPTPVPSSAHALVAVSRQIRQEFVNVVNEFRRAPIIRITAAGTNPVFESGLDARPNPWLELEFFKNPHARFVVELHFGPPTDHEVQRYTQHFYATRPPSLSLAGDRYNVWFDHVYAQPNLDRYLLVAVWMECYYQPARTRDGFSGATLEVDVTGLHHPVCDVTVHARRVLAPFKKLIKRNWRAPHT